MRVFLLYPGPGTVSVTVDYVQATPYSRTLYGTGAVGITALYLGAVWGYDREHFRSVN